MNNSQTALSITTQLLRDPLHPFPCYRELRALINQAFTPQVVSAYLGYPFAASCQCFCLWCKTSADDI